MDLLGAFGNAHMAEHRAALLREARHVEHGGALAFEMRRHADQRADRHDAGAADPGDENAIGFREIRQCWFGQCRQPVFTKLGGVPLP